MIAPLLIHSIAKRADEWRAIRILADRAEPRVRAQILKAIKNLKGSVNMAAFRRALSEGDTRGSFDIIPWEKLDEMKAPVTAELRKLLEASYAAAIKYLPKEASALRFDVTNQRAVDWLRENSARLVTEVGEGTKQAVRNIIDRSFNEGIPPVKAARMLKDIIGLTSRQADALENYRDMLLGEKRELDQVERMTARYANRQLNYRTRNIARTETINASSAGQQLLWEDALGSGELTDARTRKVWIITPDSRLCPLCAKIPGMNPKGVRIKEFFNTPVGPILHPTVHNQCRCAVGVKIVAEAA